LGSVGLWRQFPAQLASFLNRTVIAYDRLGYGDSDVNPIPLKKTFIEDEVLHFVELKKAIGVEQVVLLGHSVGGSMAVCIAADDPQVVGVITVSSQAFVEDRTIYGIKRAKDSFGDQNQFAKLVRWHGAKATWVLHAWTETWLKPSFADWRLDPWLQRMTCPVLVIHGSDDEFGSEAFPQTIATQSAGPSEMVLLQGCGHRPFKEQPNDVMEAIKLFLAKYQL